MRECLTQADAQMEQGTNTQGIATAIFQGIIYTLLEMVPEVGGVIGNLVNTAISAAMTVQTISPSPFSVTVSNLWNWLSSNFAAILTQISTMETAILSDWGKLQATYSLILSTGPNSLAWTTTTTSELVTQSAPGFAISVMQMLLPGKYQIYMYQGSDNSPVSEVPSYAQYITSIGNNTWLKYWIADISNWDLCPSQQTLQTDIFNNGTSPSDFFQGNKGWQFPIIYTYGYIAAAANNLVVTVTNNTPNLLTANAQSGQIVGSNSLTMLPYTSTLFAATAVEEVAYPVTLNLMVFNLQIIDPNISTQNPVASLNVKYSFASGNPVLPSTTQSASNGYALSSPIPYQGSSPIIGSQIPAAVQVTISLA